MKMRILNLLLLCLISFTLASQCYVSYIPRGMNNLPAVKVYVQHKNSDFYVGYTIANRFDSSESTYSNQYGICDAAEFKFDGIQMIKTGKQILYKMESEFALMIKDRADHTGGVHGDEQYTDLQFYINGKKKQFSKTENLIPCKEFRYEQHSTLHESPTKMNEMVVANPLHPIEALHFKTTEFKNSGYETFNRVIWKKKLSVDHWFFGICCVHKDNGMLYFNTSDKKRYKAIGNSEFTMKDIVGAKTVLFENKKTGLSTKVTSQLILPKNQKNNCKLMVWDRKQDTKYYRGYYPASDVEVGEIWEGKMTVRHFRNK